MSTSREREVDVLVIGGGPSGATAASLLASWGRSVVVVHWEPSHPRLGESLPAGVRKLFNLVGQHEIVAAAGFVPNDGNVASWAGRTSRTTSDVSGYHVPRARFDRVLRRFARGAGAAVIHGRVRRLQTGTPFHIAWTTTSRAEVTIRARHLLDCSGRAGIVARKGLRRADSGYRTLAVVAEWACRSWPADERTRTFVESYRDGWAWSVPVSKTRRQCTVMIDPRRRMHKSGLPGLYAAELRKAAGMCARLAGARQLTRPWACDASLYHAVRASDSGALLVGDAASFIDPLSSAGVKKALTSAWRAAVVVNTCLANPEMAPAACGLHEARERSVHAQCLRRSAAFFQAADIAYGDPFWDVRARALPDSSDVPSNEPTEGGLAADPDVRRAFEGLRAAASLRIRPSPALTFGLASTIEGRHVVMRDALVVPGLEAPLRFAAGINLPELARLAPACADVSGLMEAYERRNGAVAAPALLTGLSWLLARRVLVMET